VDVKPGAAVGEAELIAFCRERIAGFKCPKRIVFGPLPKTATGKIKKFELRAAAGASAAADV
jgi:fatty-acyl-CoA synthase